MGEWRETGTQWSQKEQNRIQRGITVSYGQRKVRVKDPEDEWWKRIVSLKQQKKEFVMSCNICFDEVETNVI